VATLISLLLVSVAVALIVLVVTAMPHLQSGAPVLSAEGEERARRGFGRVVGWFQALFAAIGQAVGGGVDALRNGPASARRPAVRQHGPHSGDTGPNEFPGEFPSELGDAGTAGVEQHSSIGPRHAAR
jgi:hypothetical protein